MKLKNIINTLSIAAVAFFATACQDTDAQIDIAEVDAPEFVSATLTKEVPVFFGETTIKVAFDKKINFASKNASQVTINGEAVDKAWVAGASNELTIVKTLDFCNSLSLHIPAGLIIGPQGKTYDEDIDETWTVEALPTNDATAVTAKLGWGWNLGNHFDTSGDAIAKGWGYWDGVATITDAPFTTLAAAGAKTVRIPVTWTDHMDDSNVIPAAYLDEVAGVVDKAIAAGLNVIINTHHDSFETTLGDAAGDEEKAAAAKALIETLWTQVATKFKDYDADKLIFETFNEVHTGDDWGTGSDAQFDLLNKWNQYAVDAIRATGGNNATRWIGVAGYAANIDLTIARLVLPEDPAKRIMVAVHCYDPYNFCTKPASSGQNSWGHNADPDHSDSAAESYVVSQLYKLRTAYINNNIPCYLGEYGCVNQPTANANAFRAYYLEFFCRAANYAGIPMMIWDNNSKDSGDEAFGYIDHADGSWLNDSETTVPMMIKACTSTDASYDFQTIWDKSPVVE